MFAGSSCKGFRGAGAAPAPQAPSFPRGKEGKRRSRGNPLKIPSSQVHALHAGEQPLTAYAVLLKCFF